MSQWKVKSLIQSVTNLTDLDLESETAILKLTKIPHEENDTESSNSVDWFFVAYLHIYNFVESDPWL